MAAILLEKVRDKEGNILGRVTVDRELFTKKLKEIWTLDQIAELESRIPAQGLAEVTMLDFLKSDIAGKDVMGYKRYRAVLKAEGFGV